MDRVLEYYYSNQNENIKLHEYLSKLGYSSSILTKLRQNSKFSLINDIPSFLNTILKYGDKITITLIEEKASEKIPAINLPLDIVYEDEDILVINKAAKVPIHPSLNNYENTLGNAIAYYYRNEKSNFVYRCVNRLDRDTTGLTIIAKNILSGSILAYKDNYSSIKKTYYAIVSNGDSLEMSGTINKPIGRKDGSTIERCIDWENGANAITHFNVIKVYNNLALIKLNLETGRTHQIRVHMASIGHPLIGDFLYNPNNHTIARQALHVGELSFTHPVTNKTIKLTAPMPDDMRDVFK